MQTLSPDARIGFIGLGAMGRPMALNLRKAGYELSVYARRPESTAPLAQAGAAVEASPAALAARCAAIITLVTSSSDSEEIALGPRGLIEGARPGAIVIDMATISPLTTRRIAQALAPPISRC